MAQQLRALVFFRASGFESQQRHGSRQLSVTPVLIDPDLRRQQALKYCTNIYASETYIHLKIIIFFKS